MSNLVLPTCQNSFDILHSLCPDCDTSICICTKIRDSPKTNQLTSKNVNSDIHESKNVLNLRGKGFNAVCLNVRSVLSKFEELKI